MFVSIHKCNHKGFSPIGRLIRWFQGTEYSHYAMSFRSAEDNVMFVDATNKNVSPYSMVNFLAKYEVVGTDIIHVADNHGFYSWLDGLYGTQYGTAQILGILLTIEKWGKGKARITCNELILRFLNRFKDANITRIDIRDLNETEEQVKRFRK